MPFPSEKDHVYIEKLETNGKGKKEQLRGKRKASVMSGTTRDVRKRRNEGPKGVWQSSRSFFVDV
ncbi:hypothetical protein ACTXT7_002385 [Hymenolepis weldensis]